MVDSSRSQRTPVLVLVLVIATAVLVMHARVVLGGKTWDDVRYHTQVAPPRLAAAEAVLAGEAPTWWDGSGLGVPLLGEPSHAAAYPLTWLAATPHALDLLAVLHLFWLALGVALWSRRLGASELACVVAGVLAGASGMAMSATLGGTLPALAHLPWVGWAAASLGSVRSAAVLGLVLGAVGLAGDFAIFIDALALALAVGAHARTWRWLALAVLGGIAIAAAQWIPALAIAGDRAGIGARELAASRFLALVPPLLYALAAVARPSRRIYVLAALLVLGGVALARGEQQLAALGMIAAAHAGGGIDIAIAGERRGLVALAIAAVATGVALAVNGFTADGAIALACLVAAGLVAWRGVSALAVAALLVAPTVGSLRSTAPVVPRDRVETPPLWVSSAHTVKDPTNPHAPLRVYRPISLYEDEPEPNVSDAIATLVGASPARYGLGAARSEDPARPAIHDRLWTASSSVGGSFLERYGIRLAILPASMVQGRGLREVARRGNWMLAEFPATPPAAMIFEWMWLPDDAATIARLFPPGAGRGLPAGVAILRGTGRAQQDEPRAPEPCTISRWARGAIDLTCASQEPAYAVVSSTNARGWSVQVDGKDMPWVTADVMRRAVELAPGAHIVSWRYAAPGLLVGVIVAGLGLLALLGALLRRVPRKPAADVN